MGSCDVDVDDGDDGQAMGVDEMLVRCRACIG